MAISASKVCQKTCILDTRMRDIIGGFVFDYLFYSASGKSLGSPSPLGKRGDIWLLNNSCSGLGTTHMISVSVIHFKKYIFQRLIFLFLSVFSLLFLYYCATKKVKFLTVFLGENFIYIISYLSVTFRGIFL